MSDADQTLFSGVAGQCGRLREDVTELLTAQAELARIELAEAADLSKRSAVWLLVAVLLLVSALPVTVVTAALAGAAYFEQSPLVWLAAGAAVLVVFALTIAWLTVRRFLRDFSRFAESLAELREDWTWLREWLGQSDDEAAVAADANSADS